MADRTNFFHKQRVRESELDLAFELLEKAERNLAADIGVYGIIGWIGKDYDMPIAVLSSLTLGLSVDFAIHFIERTRAMLRSSGSFATAAERIFEEPARAIARNAIVIALGFTPLFFAIGADDTRPAAGPDVMGRAMAVPPHARARGVRRDRNTSGKHLMPGGKPMFRKFLFIITALSVGTVVHGSLQRGQIAGRTDQFGRGRRDVIHVRASPFCASC